MSRTFNIHIAKNGKTLVAIDRFELHPCKINFLFGESGIGKSLLSKAVYGLLDPALLDVNIDGAFYGSYLAKDEVRQSKENGFFVFQEPSSHLNPLRQLDAQLDEGSLNGDLDEAAILNTLWDGKPDEAIRQILQVFPKPYRPSGGEKQRILLAMAFKKINRFLALSPAPENHLFVFDEPTGSLDNHFRNIFLDLLLTKFEQQPFTAIFITHDYSIISEIEKRPKKIRKLIVYKELSQTVKGLVHRNFSADEYLDWLKTEQKATFVRSDHAMQVLQVKSGYEIFGRRMKFIRETDGKTLDELAIYAGEMVYVKAASGVGKTTLAKLIMGLQRGKSFEMQLSGEHFTDRSPRSLWQKKVWGKSAGMVFQHADEALNLQAGVREIFRGLPLNGALSDDRLREHLQSLFDNDIDDGFLKKRVGLLSGGQKQRLNLLRSLLLDTDLLILDEPLNGLDLESIQRVVAFLQEKLRQNTAILMISHNEEIVESMVPPENIVFLDVDRS